MKKYLAISAFLFLLPGMMHSQTVAGKIILNQGQVLGITLQVSTSISQQAMGQAIEFKVDATADHEYHVTNSTEDNSTLHHQFNRIMFSFDGMGQKKKFDSKEEKDLSGIIGKPVKEMLSKSYDMIIDPTGTVLMAIPEKIQLADGDSRMAIILSMLKDVTDLVQPPAKGGRSLFKTLPDKESGMGDKWSYNWEDSNGKYREDYTLSAISDSTVTVDLAGLSQTTFKAEMMGNPTTTKMNNKTTGKIILDKATGLLKEKTTSTESNGNTESSFGDIPVTSKTTTVLKVSPR